MEEETVRFEGGRRCDGRMSTIESFRHLVVVVMVMVVVEMVSVEVSEHAWRGTGLEDRIVVDCEEHTIAWRRGRRWW